MSLKPGQAYRPFGQFIGPLVPTTLLRDPSLGALEKLLFGALALHLGKNGDRCNPRVDTLATELGVSVHKIERALSRLTKAGYLRRKSCGPNRAWETEFAWQPGLEGSLRSRPADSAPLRTQGRIDSSKKAADSAPVRDHDSASVRASYKEENVQDEKEREASSSSSERTGRWKVDEDDDEAQPVKFRNPRSKESAVSPEIVGPDGPTERDLDALGYYMSQQLKRSWLDEPVPPPRGFVVGCLKLAPGWSVRELVAALEENKLMKPGKPKGYIWFETVIPDVYTRCAGKPPEVPTLREPEPEPQDDQEPRAPAYTCATCRDTGWLNREQKVFCHLCSRGQNQREVHERSARTREEAERIASQAERFVAFAKRQSPGVQKILTGCLGMEFYGMSVDEREQVLIDLEHGTHPVLCETRGREDIEHGKRKRPTTVNSARSVVPESAQSGTA